MLLTKDIFEIVIHGRGGQGAKTAGQLIAEAAMEKGKYIQAFPEYGPERSGAPMKSFVRISDKPIKTSQPVTNPDVVMIIDPSLIFFINANGGLRKNSVLIVNSSEKPEEIKKHVKFEGNVYVVDATGISIRHLGRNLPNMPMLGALAKVTNVVDIESLADRVMKKFIKKLGREKTEANVSAIREGYKKVVL